MHHAAVSANMTISGEEIVDRHFAHLSKNWLGSWCLQLSPPANSALWRNSRPPASRSASRQTAQRIAATRRGSVRRVPIECLGEQQALRRIESERGGIVKIEAKRLAICWPDDVTRNSRTPLIVLMASAPALAIADHLGARTDCLHQERREILCIERMTHLSEHLPARLLDEFGRVVALSA